MATCAGGALQGGVLSAVGGGQVEARQLADLVQLRARGCADGQPPAGGQGHLPGIAGQNWIYLDF